MLLNMYSAIKGIRKESVTFQGKRKGLGSENKKKRMKRVSKNIKIKNYF